jgi:molybdopterin-guanine dinucleotide biosynthesis protein A
MNPNNAFNTSIVTDTTVPNLGAVILSGGSSARMGHDKAQLMLAGRTLLETVVARVAQVCNPVVVSGLASFTWQDPQISTAFVTDQHHDCGPLEGIRSGLAQLSPNVDWAFVSGCDAPEIKPELIRFLASTIGKQDEACQAIIPVDGDRIYGLTAIYRTDLASEIENLIQSGERRVKFLARHFRAMLIDVRELTAIDPELKSLANINHPAAYQRLIEKHVG